MAPETGQVEFRIQGLGMGVMRRAFERTSCSRACDACTVKNGPQGGGFLDLLSPG